MTMSFEQRELSVASDGCGNAHSEAIDEAIAEAHRTGALHLHDLDTLAPYHAQWSPHHLLQEGLCPAAAKETANPPRSLHEAVAAISAFLGAMRTQWARTQTLSSLDTFLAPYVRIDRLDYPCVKQCIRELVDNLKVRNHGGPVAPLTILGFDWTCPGDLHRESAMINRAYIEVMMTSDVRGQDFTFPIPAYTITHDFDWTQPDTERLFELTAHSGLPHFRNPLHNKHEPQSQSPSAAPTGSVGAVTLNGARIGYECRGNETRVHARIDALLELAKKNLEARRAHLQRLLDSGKPLNVCRYLKHLQRYASTIGICGVNELIRNFSADTDHIATSNGRAFALRLVDHVLARLDEFERETGHHFILDATPAENIASRFAQEDCNRCPGILQAGSPSRPSYTHSTQLPADWTDDPFELLERQEALQAKYTGTTVLHFYLNDAISSAQACRELIKRALSHFRVPHLTLTPAFSRCPEHGYLAGRHVFCPQCDAALLRRLSSSGAVNSPRVPGKQSSSTPLVLQDEERTRCEFWTRVMGYHRPALAPQGDNARGNAGACS